MTPDAIKQFQASLGISATGVIDAATIAAMNNAVSSAVAANPEIAKYVSSSDPSAIANAYLTGDWSSVTDLSGKPFTDEQQKAAVAKAEEVLAPAYKATEAYDKAGVVDTLKTAQNGFGDFQDAERKNFISDKASLDQSAADNGVLFSGARTQKLNDLRTTYADRERIQRENVASGLRSNARAYQYNYGDEAAKGLSDMYRLPGSTTFNTGVPGGGVTSNPGSISSVYSPSEFNFQGVKPVAQKAAVQTRAAGQLANRANKLTLSGYASKF